MTSFFKKLKGFIVNPTFEIPQESGSELSIYNQYPGNHSQYPKTTPSVYPFPKQDFEEYRAGQVIAESSAKDDTNIIATSGVLTCQTHNGVLDAYTTTYNFRMLLNPKTPDLKRVGYTDFRVTALGTVMRWHKNLPNWAGIHLFARYQTSDDLYVASYRVDGYITIKKKFKGNYTTLAQYRIGAPTINKEYVLAFECEGSNLRFYIDGNLALKTEDSDIAWGTAGVRMDYSDTYIDYIKITDV